MPLITDHSPRDQGNLNKQGNTGPKARSMIWNRSYRSARTKLLVAMGLER